MSDLVGILEIRLQRIHQTLASGRVQDARTELEGLLVFLKTRRKTQESKPDLKIAGRRQIRQILDDLNEKKT